MTTPRDGRSLPWRIFGRIVKPYAFAVAFATAVVSWAVIAGVAVGALLDDWPGHIVGVVGWAAVVMLWAAWWSQSDRWMQRGLLATVFVWASVWAILLVDGAYVSAWLSFAWAIASAGAWILEALDRERA